VWPFLFDTGLTLVRRLVAGENILRAHRSHLYQRLALAGMSAKNVALLYVGLASAGVLAGVALMERWRGVGVAATMAVPLLAVWLWVYVSLRERSGRSRKAVAAH
jgi:hypothetical protein